MGSGTHVIAMSEQVRAGELTQAQFREAEAAMNRSAGHCMTMGTASSMASIVEALGVGLPQNAAIPAADSRRDTLARMAGRRIVGMVHEDLVLSKILTRAAFENAIRTLAAIGGSTNAVIHLLAIAGRVGVELIARRLRRALAAACTASSNLMPSGKFLMEDFYYAGGLPAVLRALAEHGLLHKDALTGERQDALAERAGRRVLERRSHHAVRRGRCKRDAGIAVLRGNLAPNGAVIKPSAASPELLQHTGRAVVFEIARGDARGASTTRRLDIDATCIMVLKNCGPKGYPGMAEVGNLPLPKKLLREGVRDMVRISDARMSGTAYGTVVLHVAPEAAVGGPLAAVRTGDTITLDVAARSLHLHVSRRRARAAPRRSGRPPPACRRAATRSSTSITCCRPTAARTSISWSGGSGAPVGRDNH